MLDSYCIKLKTNLETELDRRVCIFCGLYYPTLTALASYTPVCSKVVSVEDVESSSESDEQTYNFQDKEVEPPVYKLYIFELLNESYNQ